MEPGRNGILTEDPRGVLGNLQFQMNGRPLNGGFLKWWYPTTMGFPTKNDHFGVFWGYHHLRKHPNSDVCASRCINHVVITKYSLKICRLLLVMMSQEFEDLFSCDPRLGFV